MALRGLYGEIHIYLTNWSHFFSVIDHEFRHNINVKVAVDLRGDGRVDPQTTLRMFMMTKFIVNNRADGLKTDINLFFTMTNCQIACSRALTHRINYKFMCLYAY